MTVGWSPRGTELSRASRGLAFEAEHPITEENWSLRREVGQKPRTNTVWVQGCVGMGTSKTHLTPAYSTWLTQDEGLCSVVKPTGESENKCLSLVQVWGMLSCRWRKEESGWGSWSIACAQMCWIPSVLNSLSSPGEMPVIHLVTDVSNWHLLLCWACDGHRRYEGKHNTGGPYPSTLI